MRVHLPTLLAFVNAALALVVFVAQFWGARAAWPGNGWALAWLSVSVVIWALVVDEEGTGR